MMMPSGWLQKVKDRCYENVYNMPWLPKDNIRRQEDHVSFVNPDYGAIGHISSSDVCILYCRDNYLSISWQLSQTKLLWDPEQNIRWFSSS